MFPQSYEGNSQAIKGKILIKQEEYPKIIVERYDTKRKNAAVVAFKTFVKKVVQLAFVLPIMVLLTLPVCIVLLFRKLFMGKPVFEKMIIVGHGCKKITIKLYNLKSWILTHSSLVFNLILGKVHFVGGSFLSEKNVKGGDFELITKYGYPGIFNLWFIRESTKIAHEGLLAIELEYLATKSIGKDLSLILKTIPALMYRSDDVVYPVEFTILNLDFINTTMKKAITIIDKTVQSKNQNKFFFVNPDCMNKLYTDREYFSILQRADYIFPDGIGISIACNILKTPLLENINGTDMLPYLCDLSQSKGYKIFLLGAKPGVAEKMKQRLEREYPSLKIAGTQSGYFDWELDTPTIIDRINASETNILLVAFGVPRQEKWIDENFDKLKPQVVMGVGGLFDFYSGEMKRAPKWMREIGMEWLFRLLKEPRRMWKRYIIGNPLFLYRVYKWKRETTR